MKAKTITRNELVNPDEPGDGWYIIEAAGQHPYRREVDDRVLALVQDLRPGVLEQIAAAGVPPEGLLVDKDHFSLDDDHPSEAMGWLRELALCEGDLAGYIQWTSVGLPLIKGRVYKHFSTVYPAPDAGEVGAGGAYAPAKLIGLALTNQPNNRTGQPPISNRELATETNKKTTIMYSPELLALLGLAEGATDEEVLGAVKDLKAAADAAAEAEAEAVVNAEAEKEGAELTNEEKEEAKEQILCNRDHGIRFTRLLCQSKRRVVSNRERRYAGTGSMPVVTNRAVSPELALTNRAKEICAAARAAGRRANWYAAMEQARREAAAN